MLRAELGRCYCICGVLTNCIIPAESSAGRDSSRSFEVLQGTLADFEQLLREAEDRSGAEPEDEALQHNVRIHRDRLAGACAHAAQGAFVIKRYKEAAAYFERELELTQSPEAASAIYHSASLVALGRLDAALQCLSGLSGRFTTDAQGIRLFGQLAEFAAVRHDARFLEVVERWRRGVLPSARRTVRLFTTRPRPAEAASVWHTAVYTTWEYGRVKTPIPARCARMAEEGTADAAR